MHFQIIRGRLKQLFDHIIKWINAQAASLILWSACTRFNAFGEFIAGILYPINARKQKVQVKRAKRMIVDDTFLRSKWFRITGWELMGDNKIIGMRIR